MIRDARSEGNLSSAARTATSSPKALPAPRATCVMRKPKRRPGRRPRWRPLHGLTEDELFLISIVTLRPGICRSHLREIYVEDCELVGRKPLDRRSFNLCVMRLVAKGMLRLNRMANAGGGYYRDPR